MSTNTESKESTGYELACKAIREGRATPRALWAILSDEHQRDGYALKPERWEGPGEYQAMDYSDGRCVFVHLPNYRHLPKPEQAGTGA